MRPPRLCHRQDPSRAVGPSYRSYMGCLPIPSFLWLRASRFSCSGNTLHFLYTQYLLQIQGGYVRSQRITCRNAGFLAQKHHNAPSNFWHMEPNEPGENRMPFSHPLNCGACATQLTQEERVPLSRSSLPSVYGITSPFPPSKEREKTFFYKEFPYPKYKARSEASQQFFGCDSRIQIA
jgi:hypothetical protein